MTAPLELVAVTAHYGSNAALLDVDLTVEAGELVAVLGANGAGKSTLVAVVAGLRRPAAGTVRVAGVDVGRAAVAARRHLGVMGQEVALYPTETLRDNMRLFAALGGVAPTALEGRVAETADHVGLSEILDRRADRCSTGQRRRAHFAAAVLHRPAVLLLDEPVAHLDMPGRRALVAIARRAADQGAAVCWCTNDAAEAAEVAATVAVLDHGRLLVRGTPTELVQRHATPTVEIAFEGTAPPLQAHPGVETSGAVVRVAVSGPQSAIEEAVGVVGEHLGAVRAMRFVAPDLAAAVTTLTEPRRTAGAGVPAATEAGT